MSRRSEMNIHELSSRMLQEALDDGAITLGNGEVRELTTAQVLAVARYIHSNGIAQPVDMSTVEAPTEMASL